MRLHQHVTNGSPEHLLVGTAVNNGRQEARAARSSTTSAAVRASNHILVVLFMVSLTVPPEVALTVGSLRLPVYRIVLLIAALPCAVALLSGKHGRINVIDVLVFCYMGWSVLALFLAHGIGRWQFFGLTGVETIVPYLIARLFVQSSEQFDSFVKIYFRIILFVLPFAIIETLTGTHILRDIAGQIFGREGLFVGRPPRLGLDRAYGPFEHPIHYGLFCATILGMIVSTQKSMIAAFRKYVLVAVAVFCSLSSGPFMLLVVQTQLKIWDVLTRGVAYRWRILAGLTLVAYILIDIVSNRTPFHVLVTYLTLRLESAYNRIHIFNFGMASVEQHPFFGIGLNEWARPPWMSSSVDNFWLVIAMRYGLPALALLVLALAVLFYRIARARCTPVAARRRTGWAISMVGMLVAGAAVHFWTEIYCLFMFMVGASYWIIHRSHQGDHNGADEPEAQHTPRRRHVAAASPYAGRGVDGGLAERSHRRLEDNQISNTPHRVARSAHHAQ
ncbi:MAG: O-antigen ligase family protein [Devosia sp.]